MQIPILTYHSAQVDGDTYESNDHVALREDLETLCAEGFRVVPAAWIVDWVRGERSDTDLERAVAITFDDGCSLDYVDLVHPTWGPQRSFFGILDDLRRSRPDAQPTLHATTFVIGSPDTRSALGALLDGPHWISDDWWRAAASSGLLAVENHSWDHNHPASRVVCQREQSRGRFDNIETYAECDAEVMRAQDYIASRAGVAPRLFAYPWGQASAYMRDVYFPEFVARHGCRAAFTAHDGFVTRDSSIWALPRVVFRANWSDREGFRRLLEDAQRR